MTVTFCGAVTSAKIRQMSTKQILAILCVLMSVVTGNFVFGQGASARKPEINLTGTVLTSDHPRCSDTRAPGEPPCQSSDWALASGRTTYLLYGDKSTLEGFERKRVRISGLLEEESFVQYGTKMIRRKILVHSIESNELPKDAIDALVSQLKVVPWRGPENHCTPLCWTFAFTDPMIQILQTGNGAQAILLDQIGDQGIQDQVVMLLGGIGDERAIWPIIETLTDGVEATLDAKSRRLNLIGNLALTNLTVSEVIWHHGGGITFDHCPTTVRSCWSKWWLEQKDTFKVGTGGDRNYTNYPNYGIYEQFPDSLPR
jgi:hypothetical protein